MAFALKCLSDGWLLIGWQKEPRRSQNSDRLLWQEVISPVSFLPFSIKTQQINFVLYQHYRSRCQSEYCGFKTYLIFWREVSHMRVCSIQLLSPEDEPGVNYLTQTFLDDDAGASHPPVLLVTFPFIFAWQMSVLTLWTLLTSRNHLTLMKSTALKCKPALQPFSSRGTQLIVG